MLGSGPGKDNPVTDDPLTGNSKKPKLLACRTYRDGRVVNSKIILVIDAAVSS